MKPLRFLSALLTVTTVSFALTAHAEPRVGAAFPAFSARDLTERWHNHRELSGHRTLVIAISGPDAGDGAQHWLNNATARYRGRVRVVTLVALDMPFYAPDGIVRGQARAHAPQHRWGHTWLDRDGNLQRALGLSGGSRTPWAFVVDESGRVVVGVHAPSNSSAAEQVWQALDVVNATAQAGQ